MFNPQCLKFLTRLRLGLSHLNEHRFRHNFKDCINSLCSCSLEVENTLYFSLHCHHYSTFRMCLMNKVNQIDENFSYLSDDNKGAYIKYVGGGPGGFYKFFRKFFATLETIDLNISWPINFFRKYFMGPPINFLIWLTCSSISG